MCTLMQNYNLVIFFNNYVFSLPSNIQNESLRQEVGGGKSWKQMHFQLPHYNKWCIMSRNANTMRLTLWVAYVYDLIVMM